MDWTAIAAIGQVLAAVMAGMSAIVAAIAITKTVKLSAKQTLLEQRQFLLPLWTQLRELDDIDPVKPVWHDVIKAANLLELIAICWEGQMIDVGIIRRMYSGLFIEFYAKIEECKNPPASISKNGREMLLACPSAMKLYKVLLDEHVDRNKLKPLSQQENKYGN